MHHEMREETRGENRNSRPYIMAGPKCGQIMGACSQASWLSQLLSGFKALDPSSPQRLEGSTALQASALLPCQDFARCNLLAARLQILQPSFTSLVRVEPRCNNQGNVLL